VSEVPGGALLQPRVPKGAVARAQGRVQPHATAVHSTVFCTRRPDHGGCWPIGCHDHKEAHTNQQARHPCHCQTDTLRCLSVNVSMRCGGCYPKRWYCCKDCQLSDWSHHKKDCRRSRMVGGMIGPVAVFMDKTQLDRESLKLGAVSSCVCCQPATVHRAKPQGGISTWHSQV
jgi:hypothetical protein